MRHIFHEIFARYLDGEQHAFDGSSRELWPEPTRSRHPASEQTGGSPAPERGRRQRVHRELESQG
jgi:hypothetical protein